MANTATLVSTNSINYAGVNVVYGYSVAIDTIDTDLTIRTPAAGNQIAVAGWSHRENASYNFTFKSSASTSLVVLEIISSNGPVFLQIGAGLSFVTNKSEELIVRSSVIVTSMLFYVIEAPTFYLK